jgi:hypothetical protein
VDFEGQDALQVFTLPIFWGWGKLDLAKFIYIHLAELLTVSYQGASYMDHGEDARLAWWAQNRHSQGSQNCDFMKLELGCLLLSGRVKLLFFLFFKKNEAKPDETQ